MSTQAIKPFHSKCRVSHVAVAVVSAVFAIGAFAQQGEDYNTYSNYPASNPGFVFFGNDMLTGVSAAKFYTHAVNFDPGQNITLNGVEFVSTQSGTSNATGHDGEFYGWANFPPVSSDNGYGHIGSPDGNSAREILRWNNTGSPHGTNLEINGLIPNGWYEVSFFIRSTNNHWDYFMGLWYVNRIVVLTFKPEMSDETEFVYRQHTSAYGANADRLLVFRYQADANGKLIVRQEGVAMDAAWWTVEEHELSESFMVAAFMNEDLNVIIIESPSDTTDVSATLGMRSLIPEEVDAVTVFWGPNDGGTSAGGWSGTGFDSASALPTDAGSDTFTASATGLAAGGKFYYRFMVEYLDGTEIWSGLGEFSLRSTTPVVEARVPSEIVGATAQANAFVSWAGAENEVVDITFYWGSGDPSGDPLSWNGAPSTSNAVPAGAVGFPMTGLESFETYHYCFFATNTTLNTCAMSEVEIFTMPGREFVFKYPNSGNYTWENAENWEQTAGSPNAYDYPNAPGDIAIIYAAEWQSHTVAINGDITLGELRLNHETTIAANNGGRLVFNKGSQIPSIEKTASETRAHIHAPLVLDFGLEIINHIADAFDRRYWLETRGEITGTQAFVNIKKGQWLWNVPEGESIVFEGDIIGGHFGKTGAGTLILRGENEFKFGYGQNETVIAGVGNGTLIFDGGACKPNAGGLYFFSGDNAEIIFANACEIVSPDDFHIGMQNPWSFKNSGNTVTVTDADTHWDANNRDLCFYYFDNTMRVTCGAVFDNCGRIVFGHLHSGGYGSTNNLFHVSDGAE
ncbi:MAG: hypothetical protein FWG05_05555, partial [Kiritimatiellaeota bacterium]|nr:hypothetical protein [Kiritimatiellota bacterium]